MENSIRGKKNIRAEKIREEEEAKRRGLVVLVAVVGISIAFGILLVLVILAVT